MPDGGSHGALLGLQAGAHHCGNGLDLREGTGFGVGEGIVAQLGGAYDLGEGCTFGFVVLTDFSE